MLDTLPTFSDAELRGLCDDPVKREAGFGAMTTAKGALPLAALEVEARLDGLIAGVEVRQTFVNRHAEVLEAVYIFPLPDRAAVTSFRLEVAGRVVEGELQERGQARRQYDQAIRTGHRAAIAEEERPGVFTMRVGNLPPGETAVVRLTLVGPMPFSDGEVTFRFPLVVAPRYIPGSPLPGPSVGSGTSADTDAVPDASRITPPVLLPGFPNPLALRLNVLIPESDLGGYDFRSSLHTIVQEQHGSIRRFSVVPGERLDRDFILRYRLDREQVHTALTVRPDPGKEEGTFLLTVLPPRGPVSRRPRDMVFVLDRSGSMGGWKMVAARRAVARMIDTLTERDRFTVYAFDDSIETPPGFDGTTLVPGSDHHRFRASEFLATIDARGGTEMEEPLNRAVKELTRESNQTRAPATGDPIDHILVLITDGQVGNEDAILKRLGQRAKGIRIFTLGIDRAVNAAFLSRLAAIGGGSCEVVESEERLDEVMDHVHRLIGSAVLTGLELRPEGLDLVPSSVIPVRLPDLFPGAPVLITGRFRGAAQGAVRLSARCAGDTWSTEVRAWKDDEAPLDKVWARGRVRELEDRYVIDRGESAKLENEIMQTSLRFGVLSRFTAFVAVDRADVVNPGGEVKQVTQAVEQPAGWGQNVTLAAAAPPNAPGVDAMRSPALRSVRGRTLSLGRNALPSAPLPSLAMPMDVEAESVDSTLCELNDDLDESGPADSGQGHPLPEWSTKCPPISVGGPEGSTGTTVSAAGGGTPPGDEGVLQRLLGLLGLGKKTKTAASLDRTPFRARVEGMLQQLQQSESDTTVRLALLRTLAPALDALFRDLVTAGDRHKAVEQLGKELVSLRALLQQAAPEGSVVEQHHLNLVAALRTWLALLPQRAAAAPGRREGFWK
jgi:Ca-activated chloride channel family protein